MARKNVSGIGNHSAEFVENENSPEESLEQLLVFCWQWNSASLDVVWYVAAALGIPGNVLSGTVWLRRHVADKNSSAVYLAALAVNDLVYLLVNFLLSNLRKVPFPHWAWLVTQYVTATAEIAETLLVLGFSVERLIAIRLPLQVCTVQCCCQDLF